MSGRLAPRTRVIALPGTAIPSWADEIRWRMPPGESRLPAPIPGVRTSCLFEGWVPDEPFCSAMDEGVFVHVSVHGLEVADIFELASRHVRATVVVDAADQELLRVVNVATGAGLPVDITFCNPELARWDELAECWRRFLHEQRTPFPVRPFAGFVTGGVGGTAFSLTALLLSGPVLDFWVDDQGRVAAGPGRAARGLFLGDVTDDLSTILSSEWFALKDGFHGRVFADGARCATCPGYRACGGYLELYGLSECKAALPFFLAVDREVARLRRDLQKLGREGNRPRPPAGDPESARRRYK